VFVLLHLGMLAAGTTLYVGYLSKKSQFLVYEVTVLLMVVIIEALAFVPDLPLTLEVRQLLVMVLLVIAGAVFGSVLGVLIAVLKPFFQYPEIGGRLYFASVTLLSIVVVVIAIADGLVSSLRTPVLSVFVVIIGVSIMSLLSLSRDVFSRLPPRASHIGPLLRKPGVGMSLLMMFFGGFFFANSYYAVVLLLPVTSLLGPLHRFVIVFFLTNLVCAIPAGIIYDRVGRRWSQLVGYYVLSLAFLLLPFLESAGLAQDVVYVTVFPVTLAIGFTLSVGGLLSLPCRAGSLREHASVWRALFPLI